MQFSERAIMAACLAFSLLGIGAVQLLSAAAEPEQVEPSQISAAQAGRLVQVYGRVQSMRSLSAGYLVRICSSGCIAAYIPSPALTTGKPSEIPRQDSLVYVTGTIRSLPGGGVEISARSANAVQVVQR